MSLTKAQARTMVRGLLHDAARDTWSDSTLDLLLHTTLDELWGEILGSAPYATTSIETVTVFHSPGYIDLRTITAGGDLAQRLYRIQKVMRNSRPYGFEDPRNISIEGNEDLTGLDSVYMQLGSQLWLFPLDTASPVELQYTYIPLGFTSLVDTDIVPWPEGYDSAYIHETVARASAEQTQRDYHAAIADSQLKRAKASIGRLYVGPTVINASDNGIEWGGL